MMKLYNQMHDTSFRAEAHTGLWFDRFYPTKENPSWLGALENDKSIGVKSALEAFCDRQKSMVMSLGGQSLAFTADWHFITGMGNPHPIENGFSWHPTLGVPYLKGSAVKGLVRSTLELAYDGTDRDKDALIHQWFGGKSNSNQTDDNTAGQLVFFDAIPFTSPTIGLDVMTPHMAKWYLEGSKEPMQPATTPADWHNPVPIHYVVAKQLNLLISFSPRPTAAIDLEDVSAVIEHALRYEGAGAKTRVGYGFFSRDKNLEDDWKTEQNTAIAQADREKNMSDVGKIIFHHTEKSGLATVIDALNDTHLFREDQKAEAATLIKEQLIEEKKWDVKPHKKYVKNKLFLRVQIVKKYLP